MSVNVGQRNVPDNPQNRQLDACEKAMELAMHTIKICTNKNIFLEEYQGALTDDIIRTAKDIYINAWSGNNVYVNSKERWAEREQYQRTAITKCNELLALINIARRLFHLKGKKVKYWSGLTLETRMMVRKWYEANLKQYGM